MIDFTGKTPFYAIHPMVTVHSEMRHRRMSCKVLAWRMRMTKADVRRMFGEFWDITPEIAAGLERALGIPASNWLVAQRLFDQDSEVIKERGWGEIVKNYK